MDTTERNEVIGIVWGELGKVISADKICPRCKDYTAMIRLGSNDPAKQNEYRCMRCLNVFSVKVDVVLTELSKTVTPLKEM